MAFFSGTYDSKLDAKGRMVLPSRLKNSLPSDNAGAIVLFKGFEQCVYVYSAQEWQKYVEKLSGLNQFIQKNRDFQRNFLSRSESAEIDSLGRFLIPKSMQEYAELDKDIKVIGAGDRVELWNPDKLKIEDGDDFANMASEIFA